MAEHSTTLPCCLVPGSTQLAALVRESLALAFPRAALTEVALEETNDLPPCAIVIIDATGEASAALESARKLRARGSTAAIVLLVKERDEELGARTARLGALEQVRVAELATMLGPAIERAIGGGQDNWPAELLAARDELRRTQRLVAAGEIALGMQHSMNNPLTAILAEAQLLELETLSPETLTAVRRIVENTRRLVTLVRRLDALKSK